MTKASSVLKSDTNPKYSVQQDYTDRVKRHRRILGERMVRERNNGHYASIRYDTLFVNDTIYRYDDNTDQIVYIGKRSRPRATLPRGGERRRTDDGQRLVGSQRGNGDDDRSHGYAQPINGATQIHGADRESDDSLSE